MMPDQDVDPARGRFFTIQAVRLAGVAFVVTGMLIVSGRLILPDWLPLWVGYLLIANGLIDVFVIPTRLVRKWRTPE
ncbi:hypothetical protein HNO88_003616 [Novosphingobium chloroacetimidivorans]|uniref:DUF2892 domain-containing protein n=1 Tax=Novosphingobium chloroacetimidivorans TaxID=1428314 RepID=A0A7W7KDI0_9SPHN|nr:hypothetical protein [Novosphingobium chloroacetimidivorans]MBB4860274.1 hypothetical protein [Novosphingobium chloroacetimidivorans]